MASLSIVVPVYNEQEALPLFYGKLTAVLSQLTDVACEIIFVDDGSCDESLSAMKQLKAADSRVRFFSFSRNFGKEAAIFAGLEHAKGDFVAVMDADLQDPPELLPEMLHALTQEGFDSAAARRVTRKGEPLLRSLCARTFYKLINKISDAKLADGARDFRLMNRKFVNALLCLPEYNRFTKGLYAWVGFKTKWLEFENAHRVAGETKWSMFGLFLYAMNGITSFSTTPLSIATVAGGGFCFASFLGMLFVIIRKLMFGDPIRGWASTMCVLLCACGVQLLCTGLVGQYLAKAYLETKRRPLYILNETSDEN